MRGRRRFNIFDWQCIAASSGAAWARRFEAAEQAAVWAARILGTPPTSLRREGLALLSSVWACLDDNSYLKEALPDIEDKQ